MCVGGDGGDVDRAGPVGAAAGVSDIHLAQDGGESNRSPAYVLHIPFMEGERGRDGEKRREKNKEEERKRE